MAYGCPSFSSSQDPSPSPRSLRTLSLPSPSTQQAQMTPASLVARQLPTTSKNSYNNNTATTSQGLPLWVALGRNPQKVL